MILSKRFFSLIFVFMTGVSGFAENRIVVLGDSQATHLSVDLSGGAFVDFRTGTSPNPFSWRIPSGEMPENNRQGAAFQGHFLCLGRWGAPTAGEISAGVPHNGQSGNGDWEIVSLVNDSMLHIRSEALLDGVVAERMVCFDRNRAIFRVTDVIESVIPIGRPFNVVQHATVGAPFLSSNTRIDSNAQEGFMQDLSYPDPHRREYVWPQARMDTLGSCIDLTRSEGLSPYVSTHLFHDSVAWVTAASPDCGWLIGYVWRTADYPWLNVWHDVRDGKPYAKGLEFGTTGIGRPYQDLLAVDTRFHGVNSFFYLDALEKVSKSFIGFMVEIPADFRGVESLRMVAGNIVLTEHSAANDTIIR
jgi:hypothetical protein